MNLILIAKYNRGHSEVHRGVESRLLLKLLEKNCSLKKIKCPFALETCFLHEIVVHCRRHPQCLVGFAFNISAVLLFQKGFHG